MKKTIIYIIVLLISVIITSGVTYAYLRANVTKDSIDTDATQIEVIYTNGNKIDEKMSLGNSKEDGYNTTVYIRQTNNSVPVKASIFIDINSISPYLASQGFIWEVYKTYNGTTTKAGEGNFLGCEGTTNTKKCANGDRMYFIKDYVLLTDNTGFTIYFWVNGNLVGNEVIGAKFNGEIGAHTNQITGEIS